MGFNIGLSGLRAATSDLNVTGNNIANADTTGFKVERELAPLEEIRFRDARKYNYSAVVEAICHAGWDDVVGGEGGPFNPPVPPEVSAEVETAISGILHYH